MSETRLHITADDLREGFTDELGRCPFSPAQLAEWADNLDIRFVTRVEGGEMTKRPGENHWDYLRRLVLEYEDYSKDKHAVWINRTSGPNWPILRRYVTIIDIAKQQAEYIRELQGIIEEMDKQNGN